MSFWDWFKNKQETEKDTMIELLTDEIAYWQKMAKEDRMEWNNPYGWTLYTGDYKGISGIEFPLNTCLSINDKNIKYAVSKNGLKKPTILETALAIERFLNERIRYVYDKDNNFHKGYVEWWQQASMTWALLEGDCDDYALVFQTMMHICGYGKETITCAGMCDFSAFKQGNVGHAYNRVLVDNVWVVIDACNGASNRKKIVYPSMKDEWFKLNYWSTFNP